MTSRTTPTLPSPLTVLPGQAPAQAAVSRLIFNASDPCLGEPLIEMADIIKIFKTPAGDFPALKGVTTCFYPGEFVSVVGKSGSGKSTLVNMLTGIDHPTSGTVRVRGTYIHKLDESAMSLWRGRNLGIVFQFFQLLPMISLLDNVVLPMDLCKVFAPGEREKRALELLRLVGLSELAGTLPAAISGGQQQSVAIARALANDPPIVIADEPTGNLDSHAAETVFQLFASLVEAGKTVIMVTHDSSLAARAGRALLLVDGELVDPRVARAFPALPHTRLLWLNHQLKPQRYAPGQPLPEARWANPGLLLVAAGTLAVSLEGHASGPRLLGPGDFLGPWDCSNHLQAAGDEPLELLALDPGALDAWVHSAPDEERLLRAARGTG